MLALADTIERTVGGTSSAIYCIFLNALGGGLAKYGSDEAGWIKGNTGVGLKKSLVFGLPKKAYAT